MAINYIQKLRGELSFRVTEENFKIRAEQLRARLQVYPVMLITQVLLEPLFVWLFWDHSSHLYLLTWLICFYVIHAIDTYQWLRGRDKLSTIQECRNMSLFFNILTGFTALMWGLTALYFFPNDLAYQALLICISLGLAAGAITLDSVYPPSLYIFVLGVTLPLLIRLILVGAQTQLILAGMLLLFLFATISAGRSLSKTFWRSLWQRHENDFLVEQLTMQKAIAESANHDKSRFLATASHDLRQPLQALVLFSESLQEITMEEEPKQLSMQIGKSVSALVDMFDELLDISKLDAGVVLANRQNFAVHEVMDRLHSEFQPLAAAKGIAMEMPATSFHCYSDPLLLERILRNLISNAIRYTDFGTVSVICAAEDKQLQFSVADTGIGIRASSLPHIFEEYYQVANQHRDRLKGLGLGLAIVRRMEVLLGCHITVLSKPALGSSFSFHLPQSVAAQMPLPQNYSPQQHDISGTIVALVEDNPEIRLIASRLIKQWGCLIFEGELPQEVLDNMLQAGVCPDILICDYRLPLGLTALDCINLIRQHWHKPIPAVVLTGDTAPQTMHEIQASGAILLHKPVTPARLRSVVYFALRNNKHVAVDRQA
ncbi:MAG: hybrid sensor histidine kinase/response regulator [Gallionellaceae bacterium]|jgi:signal transduction histidine kinase/CheY-like chemotaxis protein